MDLKALFDAKDKLKAYRPQTFQVLQPNQLDIGMARPVIFVADQSNVLAADYFSLNSITDIAYDIHMVTYESFVLMYLIDVKTKYYNVMKNGMVIRTRKHWDPATDQVGIDTSYTFDDFKVIANRNKSSSVFCKNISAIPTT